MTTKQILPEREEPQYCIVWEVPKELDEPVKVTVPTPEWLAMTMHGNVSEEEAMEYLLQKDVPSRVWADNTSNTPHYYICKRSMIPTNREFRNAWRINKELEIE